MSHHHFVIGLARAACSVLLLVASLAQSQEQPTTPSSNVSPVNDPGNTRWALRSLVWVDRKGEEQPLKMVGHAYRTPRISPDGRRVAVMIEEPTSQLWIYDLSRETLTPLTPPGSVNMHPTWTPDGRRIVFQSNRAGSRNLFWQLSDGNSEPEELATGQYNQTANSFSPDGQLLAFVETNPNSRDIWLLLMSDRKAQPFLKTPADEGAPRFSPDGHWLAYSSDESGRREIYVQSFPGPGGKWRISMDGGQEPVWSPSGWELFYRNGRKIMVVEITILPNFSAGAPRMLFEGPYVPTTGSVPNYDVSPDGQRFLMVKPPNP